MNDRSRAGAHLPVAFALLGLGCAQTHTVTRPLSPPTLAALQSDTNGKEATVAHTAAPPAGAHLTGPVETTAGLTYVDRDVVRVLDHGRSQAIPLSEVREIRRSSVGEGVAHGAIAGAVLGVLAGVALGAALGKDCDSQSLYCIDRGQTMGGLAVLLAIPGLLIGGGVGAKHGSRTTWTFDAGAR
jgi:hypothetical protein